MPTWTRSTSQLRINLDMKNIYLSIKTNACRTQFARWGVICSCSDLDSLLKDHTKERQVGMQKKIRKAGASVREANIMQCSCIRLWSHPPSLGTACRWAARSSSSWSCDWAQSVARTASPLLQLEPCGASSFELSSSARWQPAKTSSCLLSQCSGFVLFPGSRAAFFRFSRFRRQLNSCLILKDKKKVSYWPVHFLWTETWVWILAFCFDNWSLS